METFFKSIDDVCDLTFAHHSLTIKGEDYFYFSEQSSIQVLREMPKATAIKVTNLSSERHRIFQKTDAIKNTQSIQEFFNIVLPLVEDGNFPCTDITIIIDNQIELSSHDDGEVHLLSANKGLLYDLIKKILTRQRYAPEILTDILNQPNLYLKLERPNKIIATYSSFEEVIEAS